tara:strand:- start:609 stop:1337 length:729 start_codon:yes stop_codon:yes gene_type:complete
MKGLNNPIGIKSSEPSQSPFIMNPYRYTVASSPNDFSDDFSSDNWTTYGTFNNIDSGVLNYNGKPMNNSTNICAIALADGTASDTSWVLRFTNIMDTMSYANPGGGWLFFGLSDNMSNLTSSTAQDSIGINQGAYVYSIDTSVVGTDGGGLPIGSGTNGLANPTAGTYYWDVKRASATSAELVDYTSDSFSSGTTYANTIASTIVNLDSVKVQTRNVTASANGSNDGKLDDLYFWDNVTSAP